MSNPEGGYCLCGVCDTAYPARSFDMVLRIGPLICYDCYNQTSWITPDMMHGYLLLNKDNLFMVVNPKGKAIFTGNGMSCAKRIHQILTKINKKNE